jgi:aldehyde dehydrogenase (NAD+)
MRAIRSDPDMNAKPESAAAPRYAARARSLLDALGVPADAFIADGLPARSPLSGETLVHVRATSAQELEAMIAQADVAFRHWRLVPAPRRGELVRLLGERFRMHKHALGELVSLEVGKSRSEGLGEVQEMIDVCEFAVGLSRQLYGLTIASERAEHRLMEQWHPAGVVGVISAFNFPVAVWSWNAALALVCGDPVVWKPSEKAPLTALSVQAIWHGVLAEFGQAPEGLLSVAIGGAELGAQLAADRRIPVLSATGSTRMGRSVGVKVAERFARAILELGGNNCAIVAPSADLELALRAVAFGAMGTAGQRCTTIRRLLVHASIYEPFLTRLRSIYGNVTVGDPLESDALVGPLIDAAAFEAMQNHLAAARAAGARITGGERVSIHGDQAYFVRPALIELDAPNAEMREEIFAPILSVLPYDEIADAIAIQNDVPQGLSSAIFSNDFREVELFLSAAGSDCGLANVNMGTSGAEIGAAFGGDKETGGGRESGSDAWKGYMRRQTSALNRGRSLPLAQGVKFDLPARPEPAAASRASRSVYLLSPASRRRSR